jgi:hypothetical protein
MAQEIEILGRGVYSDIFGDEAPDNSELTVILYATDSGRARQLVADAKKERPETAHVSVVVVKCEYTRNAEDAQVARLLEMQKAKPFSYPIFAGNGAKGAGIIVGTSADAVKSDDFKEHVRAAVAPMPVSFRVTSEIVPG